jgi:hypothetical protein
MFGGLRVDAALAREFIRAVVPRGDQDQNARQSG